MVVVLLTTSTGGMRVVGVLGGGGHHLAVGGEEGVVLFSVEGAQRLLIFAVNKGQEMSLGQTFEDLHHSRIMVRKIPILSWLEIWITHEVTGGLES